MQRLTLQSYPGEILMSLQIRNLSRDDKDFYRLMGPFFGSRTVAKEIGIHIYDDESKEWFAAFIGPAMIGFASLNGSVISDCYVKPDYRRSGYFRKILQRIMLVPGVRFRASCTAASVNCFISEGFHSISYSRNFVKVLLNA